MRKEAPVPSTIVKGDLDIRVMNQLKNMAVSSIMDQMSSTNAGRSDLAKRLGYEYQGDRDVYTALGYSKELTFDDYYGKYKRGDIARRIIKEPVIATWRSVPVVNESIPTDKRDKDIQRTPFEMAWDTLVSNKNLMVWHNIRKTDLISGIGRWGVMFLGFGDVETREKFADEVPNGADLLYLTPLNESQASISEVESDVANPRFGKPKFYELQFQSTAVGDSNRSTPGGGGGGGGNSQSVRVHYTRIIHIAEEADESGVVGTPRLECVYNRLLDLDRVVGSCGESFWRQAFPGLNFKLDKESQYNDQQDLDKLKEQIDGFVHKWERYIRTQGVEIEELSASVASPKDSFEVIVATIASARNIPQRVLLGSERGELASSQDQTQYGLTIQERRTQYVEPVMLDQFIMRMIEVGTLPTPLEGWTYVWASLFAPSDKERAEAAKNRTEALVKYADSIGASQVVPLGVFLRSESFLGFTEDEAAKIEEMVDGEAAKELIALEDERNTIIDDEEDIEGTLE